jgi:F0F1-type ATP synthase membrane subunit c/vacuolar-type H+-ATPase subunit K
MIAEDGSKFGLALLFTVLPETIVLFGFLTLFLL